MANDDKQSGDVGLAGDARPSPEPETLVAFYRDRAQTFTDERRAHERTSARLSNLRVAAFLLGVVAVVIGWRLAWYPAAAYGVAALSAVGFVALVVGHRRVQGSIRRARLLTAQNEQGAARIVRDWRHLPRVALPHGIPRTAMAVDLDLFGEASLYQLICQAQTTLGRRRLAEWLTTPTPAEEIPSRQQAVDELAPRVDWRQELAFLGTPESGEFPSIDGFLAWAEGPPWLAERAWLKWVSRLLPLAFWALGVLWWTDLWPQKLWLVVFLANTALSLLVSPKVHKIFARVSSRRGDIQRYAKLLEYIASERFSSPRMAALHEQLETEGHRADEQIGRLRRLMDLADLRYNQIYLPIQAATLWDFHVLAAVERWQHDVDRHVREWFEALAEIEAIA